MVWVYVIVALGLIGIIVETWLSFRKELEEIQEDVHRVRMGIRQHEAATSGLEEKRVELEAHSSELRSEREEYTGEVEMKRQTVDELLARWRLHHPGDPFDIDPGHIR